MISFPVNRFDFSLGEVINGLPDFQIRLVQKVVLLDVGRGNQSQVHDERVGIGFIVKDLKS